MMHHLVAALLSAYQLDAYGAAERTHRADHRSTPDRVEDLFVVNARRHARGASGPTLGADDDNTEDEDEDEGASVGDDGDPSSSSLRSAVATACVALAVALPSLLRDTAIPIIIALLSSSSTSWLAAEAAVAFAAEFLDEVPASSSPLVAALVSMGCGFLEESTACLVVGGGAGEAYGGGALIASASLRAQCVKMIERAQRNSTNSSACSCSLEASAKAQQQQRRVLHALWHVVRSDPSKTVATAAIGAFGRLTACILSPDVADSEDTDEDAGCEYSSEKQPLLGPDLSFGLELATLFYGFGAPRCSPQEHHLQQQHVQRFL